jgi:hypothetical protein
MRLSWEHFVFEWIGPTVTAIKNAGPPVYAAVFVSASMLLFLPDAIITQLGLTEFRESYRTYAGVALLASASLLVVQGILAIIPIILIPWQKWRWRRDTLELLSNLTEYEKAFLRPYIFDGENTQYAPYSDGVPRGLQSKRLIYRASEMSSPGGNFAFNLQPRIRQLLNDRPDLLK